MCMFALVFTVKLHRGYSRIAAVEAVLAGPSGADPYDVGLFVVVGWRIVNVEAEKQIRLAFCCETQICKYGPS